MLTLSLRGDGKIDNAATLACQIVCHCVITFVRILLRRRRSVWLQRDHSVDVSRREGARARACGKLSMRASRAKRLCASRRHRNQERRTLLWEPQVEVRKHYRACWTRFSTQHQDGPPICSNQADALVNAMPHARPYSSRRGNTYSLRVCVYVCLRC